MIKLIGKPYVCIGGSALYNLVMTLLIIVSILIVIATMMQPQKQQDALENSVFTQLNKTYRTPEAFQDYGVMYWRDNQLHVALKSSADMDTVKANLASQGNSTINNYVVVEPSQYSQTEYDVIESNFRNYYSKNEKGGNVIAIFPDVENNQLYAVVSTASRETQQGISKVFGSKVKMTVKR